MCLSYVTLQDRLALPFSILMHGELRYMETNLHLKSSYRSTQHVESSNTQVILWIYA